MTAPVGVLIVDDDALVRAGLSMILAGVEDIRVVGRSPTALLVRDAELD